MKRTGFIVTVLPWAKKSPRLREVQKRPPVIGLKKLNLQKAGSSASTCDYLCPINDNGSFEKHFKEIYPEELELKKEKVSYLNINLDIKENNRSTKLFDKWDFESVCIFFLNMQYTL